VASRRAPWGCGSQARSAPRRLPGLTRFCASIAARALWLPPRLGVIFGGGITWFSPIGIDYSAGPERHCWESNWLWPAVMGGQVGGEFPATLGDRSVIARSANSRHDFSSFRDLVTSSSLDGGIGAVSVASLSLTPSEVQ
jgi:hypothetical protein